MKLNKKFIYIIIFLIIVVIAIYIVYIQRNTNNIVSWCIGDANNDGNNEILFITGDNKRNDDNELYGNQFAVCDLKYLDNIKKDNIKDIEKIFNVNLEKIKPIKAMIGDINGDGLNEISLCVYKSTKFHPELAKRPFFYLLSDNRLLPVWRGSCLSRPFTDYELFDMDNDSIDEIISIERLQDGKFVLATYSWLEFGFVKDGESDSLEGQVEFNTINSNGSKMQLIKNNYNNYFFDYDSESKKILLGERNGD